MKNSIGLLFIFLGIELAIVIEKPWANKTPSEIEKIIDSISINAPTVV